MLFDSASNIISGLNPIKIRVNKLKTKSKGNKDKEIINEIYVKIQRKNFNNLVPGATKKYY